jgi:chromate transporter
MLDEVVDRKGWLTREHFLHLVGITNLLPGPNSSEVAIHIGYTQRGWRGALASGLSFLAPTFVLVVFFSFLYFRFGSLPQVEGVFWGLKPAILAVILSAGWKLGKVAMAAEGPGSDGTRTPPDSRSTFQRSVLIFLALGGMAAALLLEGREVAAMAVGGVLGWGLLRGRKPGGSSTGILGLVLIPTSSTFLPSLVAPMGQLFGLMLGAGAVLFGGGYMLVALLEPFVVERFAWLTPQQFLDGIALTGAVPGPIVTLVAFVGFAVAGVPGAAVATVGIYIPSFLAVLLVAPWLERWRHLEGVGAALKGVNAVVAGAILGVGVGLIPPAIQDLWGSLILIVALVALVRFKAKAIWIVGAGIGFGLIHTLISI